MLELGAGFVSDSVMVDVGREEGGMPEEEAPPAALVGGAGDIVVGDVVVGLGRVVVKERQ